MKVITQCIFLFVYILQSTAVCISCKELRIQYYILHNYLFSDVTKSSSVIQEHLIDELDYVLVPEPAWQKLLLWCGLMQGQVSQGNSFTVYLFCHACNLN